MAAKPVPDIVVGRLPVYLRLVECLCAQDERFVSSEELARRLNISAVQIRKDLSYFGGFGKQGAGYEVQSLRAALRRILKIEQDRPVALIGMGDLGHALARYGGFANEGFFIAALFDNDPAKIGTQVGDLLIQDVRQLGPVICALGIQIAILTVPASAAQGVADVCVRAGVRAILNYAPTALSVPENVRVQYTDPVRHLQRMTFYL